MVPITEGYIVDMLPIDAVARTGIVTGKQIKDWLEKELQNVFAKEASGRFGGWVVKMKGMSVEFKAFEELGQRVQKVMVGDLPLDLQREYRYPLQNIKSQTNPEFRFYLTSDDEGLSSYLFSGRSDTTS